METINLWDAITSKTISFQGENVGTLMYDNLRGTRYMVTIYKRASRRVFLELKTYDVYEQKDNLIAVVELTTEEDEEEFSDIVHRYKIPLNLANQVVHVCDLFRIPA